MKVKCSKCGASLVIGESDRKIKVTLILVIDTGGKRDNIHLHKAVELPFVPSPQDVIKVGDILHHVEYASYTDNGEWIRIFSRDKITGHRSLFKKKNKAAVDKLVKEYRNAGWY